MSTDAMKLLITVCVLGFFAFSFSGCEDRTSPIKISPERKLELLENNQNY